MESILFASVNRRLDPSLAIAQLADLCDFPCGEVGEAELGEKAFMVDCVDAAKEVTLGDRGVKANTLHVQLPESELCEGSLESQTEHIGMMTFVIVHVRALALHSLRIRTATMYSKPQVWQSQDSNGTREDLLCLRLDLAPGIAMPQP